MWELAVGLGLALSAAGVLLGVAVLVWSVLTTEDDGSPMSMDEYEPVVRDDEA